MEVTVTVRHFELNSKIRDYAVEAINSAFADFRLRISRADMILDLQRNLITANLTVSIKESPVASTSNAYDNVYKAIDEAVDKAATQARKYLEKKQEHRG